MRQEQDQEGREGERAQHIQTDGDQREASGCGSRKHTQRRKGQAMSIRRAIILITALALTVLLPMTATAGARSTRELLTTFGAGEYPSALAVDLETGNVYVAEVLNDRVDIFGPDGGAPVGGVPFQITGILFAEGGVKGANHIPVGLAIDNSCYEHNPRLTGKACEEFDPSYGDLFVHEDGFAPAHIGNYKLNSQGEYKLVDEINSGETGMGLAVDSEGNIYAISEIAGSAYFNPATEFEKIVEKVVNAGKEEVEESLEEIKIPQHIAARAGYIGVDDLGGGLRDLYVGDYYEEKGTVESFGVAALKINAAGSVVSEGVLSGPAVGLRPVAVDPSSGAVYVGVGSETGTEIAEYGPENDLKLKFGSSELAGGSFGRERTGPIAIAVNSETERVYVANVLRHDIDVFGPVIGPPVVGLQQPVATNVTRTSGLIAGDADPESSQEATFFFEYVDGEEYEPGAAEPYRAGGRTATEPLAGSHSIETTPEVALTGLLPGTTYHYRLIVSSAAGTSYGPDETFTTTAATPPTASTGLATEVTATSVTLSGAIAPRGLPTSYVFEVGTDTNYGGPKLFGSAGAGTGEVAVSVGLQYLVPGATYHYRLVATSFDGTSYGQDETFTTPGIPSPIGQPASTALIPSPTVQFPSIAGAITEPLGKKGKQKKSRKRKRTNKKRKMRGKKSARKR
jgi:hypothetical protein